MSGRDGALWIERYARVVGVERACRRLWGDARATRAPYVFALVVWSVVNVPSRPVFSRPTAP